jgi:hypothetical protein
MNPYEVSFSLELNDSYNRVYMLVERLDMRMGDPYRQPVISIIE